MITYYILDEQNNPVAVESDKEYVAWLTQVKGNRKLVKATDIGSWTIETRFEGHVSFYICGDEKRPVFFETMPYEDRDDGYGYLLDLQFGMWYFTTWADAIKGHEAMCALVRSLVQEQEAGKRQLPSDQLDRPAPGKDETLSKVSRLRNYD